MGVNRVLQVTAAQPVGPPFLHSPTVYSVTPAHLASHSLKNLVPVTEQTGSEGRQPHTAGFLRRTVVVVT